MSYSPFELGVSPGQIFVSYVPPYDGSGPFSTGRHHFWMAVALTPKRVWTCVLRTRVERLLGGDGVWHGAVMESPEEATELELSSRTALSVVGSPGHPVLRLPRWAQGYSADLWDGQPLSGFRD